jgi:hypothetical protein
MIREKLIFKVPVEVSALVLNPQEIFLTNLHDWFDYTDDSTLTKSGVLLDAIDSKATGSTRQFISTAGNRPDIVAAQVNGLQVARLDGVSEFMVINSSTGSFNFMHDGSNGGMILMVARVNSDTGSSQFLIGNNLDSSTLVGYGMQTNTSKYLASFIATGVASARASFNNTGTAMYADYNSFNVFSDIVDPANATAANRSKISSNFGSYFQNNTDTNTPSNSNASVNLFLGKKAGTNTLYASLDVAEIIIVKNQPTATQLVDLQTYIENKYGNFPI